MKYYLNLIRNKKWSILITGFIIALPGFHWIYSSVVYILQEILYIYPFGILLPCDESMGAWAIIPALFLTYAGMVMLPVTSPYAQDLSEFSLEIIGDEFHIRYKKFYWEIKKKDFINHEYSLSFRDKNGRYVSLTRSAQVYNAIVKKEEQKGQKIEIPLDTPTVKSENLCGGRKAEEEEKEYLKGIMLNFVKGPGSQCFMFFCVFLMIAFPIGVIKALVTDAFNRYAMGTSEISFISLEGIVCLVLTVIAVFGIRILWSILKDIKEDTLKEDILKERFYVIDVDIVEYYANNDDVTRGDAIGVGTTSEPLVLIKDREGNVADRTMYTVNWQEVKRNGKALYVVFEKENGEKQGMNRVFPGYDAKSKFCIKMRNNYRKKNG